MEGFDLKEDCEAVQSEESDGKPLIDGAFLESTFEVGFACSGNELKQPGLKFRNAGTILEGEYFDRDFEMLDGEGNGVFEEFENDFENDFANDAWDANGEFEIWQ